MEEDIGDGSEALDVFSKAMSSSSKAQKLTSINDWAPLNSGEIPRGTRSHRDDDYGLAYTILRWPILIGLYAWITFLLAIYALIRTYVALNESLFVWRGRRRELRSYLRSSDNYADWQSWAQMLDNYLGISVWKGDPRSAYYDYRTILKLVDELKKTKDPEELASLLEACVRYNFAGVQNSQLYSQCYAGTKDLIKEFNTLLVQKVEALRDTPKLSPKTKHALFRSFDKNLGRSALVLSGGASFSYRHFGVVRALLEQDLLPNIVSGTSGGGLVAAFVCTRTNEELRGGALEPAILASHLTACWEPFPAWVERWWKTGARFDAVDWASRCRWMTRGDLTFREAYERTGKVLNISTIPADPHSPAILCNHITSPDCVIWSAVLASAAVPGILNPVSLIMKSRRTGKFMPYNFGSKWKDGSLRTDVPLTSLNTFFGVNFSICSQVNPHIKLFAYLPKGQVGRPIIHKFSHSRWRGGFMFAAAETFVKLEIKKCLKLVRNLDIMPQFMSQDWSNVFLQRFEGTVTVWPKIKLTDFYRILSDPDASQLTIIMQAGERSMYPKIEMIRSFVMLERAVASGLTGSSDPPTPTAKKL